MPARRHHPTLPPSSFPALAKCSLYRSGGAPGEAARRGTRIGATVEKMLTGEAQEDAYTPAELRYGDGSLLEEVNWIHQTVCGLMNAEGLQVEGEVPLLDADFREVTFGTFDYFSLPGQHLADLKTGEKRDYKPQMAVLALGLMDKYGFWRIRVSILWSKYREVETWEWTRDDVEAIVWPIIERAGKGPATPNDYCGWCARRETCAERVGAANMLPAVLASHDSIASYMETLTPGARAALLRQIQVARKWCDDAEAAVEAWFLTDPQAHAVEGYKLGVALPNRVWANEMEASAALQAKAQELGKDPTGLWHMRLAGQTKVQELLGRSKPVKALIDSLLIQPPGKPAMVPDWTAKAGQVKPQEATLPLETKPEPAENPAVKEDACSQTE